MNDDDILLRLLIVFAPLSLLSLGGGQAIVAEIHSQSVDIHHWVTNQQFANLYAISRAAPGPSTLIAALIGWRAGGFMGALITTFALYIPSSLLVYGVGTWWQSRRESRWFRIVERGLAPPAIGLLLAGAYTVLQASDPTAFSLVVTVATTILIYVWGVGPYVIVGAVTLIYLPIAFF